MVVDFDEPETPVDFEPLFVPLEVAFESEKDVVLETLVNPEPLLAPLEDDTRLVKSVVGRVELVDPLLVLPV